MIGLFGLASCASQSHPYKSPNFDPALGIFVNTDGSIRKSGMLKGIELAWAFLTRESDPSTPDDFPLVPASERETGSPSATWIGHATLLVDMGGITVLTDPMFSERASPLSFAGPKRIVPPGIAFDDLPDIDVIVISHSHYDHLDMPTLAMLAARFPDLVAVVPLGLGAYAKEAGITDVREGDWWHSTTYKDLTITLTPMHHWSARSPFDRNQTQWAGFWIERNDLSFLFLGDTGYSTDFTAIRERLGKPDLAGIPIGGYLPRDFMRTAHVNPDESVQIFRDLDAGLAIGLHWGTFRVTTEPMRDPPAELTKSLGRQKVSPAHFRALKHGETWVFGDALEQLDRLEPLDS